MSLYFAELIGELLTLFLFFIGKGLFLFYYYLFFDLFTLFYLSEGGDGSLFQIEINIAEILLDCMVLELIDLVGKASEEVTVVGYDDECSFEALECLLENVLGGDVQVVGRLVHHQYVKGGEEHFGQSQAIAFAP